MLTVSRWYDAINSFAPFHTAMDFDNVGLLVGSGELPADSALLALDVTTAVLEEAVEGNFPLIITHHPIIFHPMKQLSADSLPYQLARHGISVISAHTNLDLAPGGVNDALAERLELTNIRALKTESQKPYYKVVVFVPIESAERVYQAMAEAGAGGIGNYNGVVFSARGTGRFRPTEGAHPAIGEVGILEAVEEERIEMIVAPGLLGKVVGALVQAHPYEEVAYDVYEDHAIHYTLSIGRLGELKQPLSPEAFGAYVKDKVGADGVRLVAGGEPISTVALCGGSGADLLEDAQQAGAQALVTGEALHHFLLEAGRRGITLVDAGHHHTEAVVLEPLQRKLQELLPEGQTKLTRHKGTGVQYL